MRKQADTPQGDVAPAAPELTPDEEAALVARIAARRQALAEDCLAEVGAVLETYGCVIVGVLKQVGPGLYQAEAQVVPKG